MVHILGAGARLLDAVAPRRCAGCGRSGGDGLCEACVELILGLPLPPPPRHAAIACRAAIPYAPPASSAIRLAKYAGCRRAMHVLAWVAAERLAPQLLALPAPHAVVPVALGGRRRRARGYNQARVAALAVAALVPAVPVMDGLRRLRETPTQVGRSRQERQRNLCGAFAWAGPPLAGRALWLVDDVVTTGATLASAARTLQQAGAGRIEAVAVAATPE